MEVLDTVAVAREEEMEGWLDVVSMADMAMSMQSLASSSRVLCMFRDRGDQGAKWSRLGQVRVV